MGWLKIKSHIQALNFPLTACYALISLEHTASASGVCTHRVWLPSAPQVGEASFVHDKSGEDSSQALSAAAQPLALVTLPALSPLLIPVSVSLACL